MNLRWFSERVDAQEASLRRFVEVAARQIPAGARVLDAGAGNCPYSSLLAHTLYESCDIDGSHHTFCADVSRIPRPDGYYDAVLCTQVLDDVPDPHAVMRELARVLRHGGRLYLTAPQNWGLHGEPCHFFNFTPYGLRVLCAQADLEVETITTQGGWFLFLGYQARLLGRALSRQNRAWRLVTPITAWVIPMICHYLDPLDREQRWTLGHGLVARKPEEGGRAQRQSYDSSALPR